METKKNVDSALPECCALGGHPVDLAGSVYDAIPAG